MLAGMCCRHCFFYLQSPLAYYLITNEIGMFHENTYSIL